MKPSRIICSRGATLRGLITADTSAGGGQTHMCSSPWRSFTQRGRSTMRVTAVMMSSKRALARCVKKKKKMLAYARTVDLGGSGAWQPHYRQCIIPSNTGGRTSLLKELHGFTINNETQMAFYTFWLTVRGSSCFCFFSYFTPLSFFLPLLLLLLG